jgi:hypothetical protein
LRGYIRRRINAYVLRPQHTFADGSQGASAEHNLSIGTSTHLAHVRIAVVADLAMQRLEATSPEVVHGGISKSAAAQPVNGHVSSALHGANAAASAPAVALHTEPSQPSWAARAAAGRQEDAPPLKAEHTLESQPLQPAEVVSSLDSTLPTEVMPSLGDTPATEVQQPGRSDAGAPADATVSDSPAPADAAAACGGGVSNAAVSPAAQGHSPHLGPLVEPSMAAGQSNPPACGTPVTASKALQEGSAAAPAPGARCSPEPRHEAALGQDPGQGAGHSAIEEAHLPLQLVMGSLDEVVNVTSPSQSHSAGGGLDPAPASEAISHQVIAAEGDVTVAVAPKISLFCLQHTRTCTVSCRITALGCSD